MMNMDEFLVKNHHYMLFYLGLSFYPKMLFVLDENLENVPTNIRVGQGVDVVG